MTIRFNDTHITQYTAWLEVDTFDRAAWDQFVDQMDQEGISLDTAVESGSAGGLYLPLGSFEISAEINGLPQASAVVATGLNVTSYPYEQSPAHGFMRQKVVTAGDYIHAKIWFRNMTGGPPVCIFDGFIHSVNYLYNVNGLQLMFSMVHWGIALDMCPVICTSLTLEGAESHCATFLHKMIAVDGGANQGRDNGQLPFSFTALVENVTEGIKRGEASAQVVPAIFQPILLGLHRANERQAPEIKGLGSFVASERYLPPGYKIADILNSASANSFSVSGVQKAVTPDLSIRTDVKALSMSSGNEALEGLTTLREALIQGLLQGLKDTRAWHGTAWSFLQMWADLFHLTIVPRVHELCFVPKWEVIPQNRIAPLELEQVVSMNGGKSTIHPAAAMLAIPSDEMPSTDRQNRFYWFDLDYSGDRRGGYKHPDKETGPTGITVLPWVLSGYGSGFRTDSGESIAQLYAKTEFWRRQYMGSRASVLSPIRFDVCPGSTVKFNTGSKHFIEMNSVGHIQKIDWSFNPSQGAVCSMQAGFVRPADSEEGADAHLYYISGPFSHATWVSDSQFTTF